MIDQELIERIRTAFHGVELGDGISLNMTEYLDSYSTEEYNELAKSDERRDWSNIPDEILERFTCTFSFTDVAGFRFYMPAYMIYMINNHATSHSIICDFTFYTLDPDRYPVNESGFERIFNRQQME